MEIVSDTIEVFCPPLYRGEGQDKREVEGGRWGGGGREVTQCSHFVAHK